MLWRRTLAYSLHHGHLDMILAWLSETFTYTAYFAPNVQNDYEGITFVAPLPPLKSNTLVLVNAMKPIVYGFIALAFAAVVLALYLLDGKRRAVVAALWQAFALLIGENVSSESDTASMKRKIVLGTWMACSFFLTAGVGSLLRSLFLKPERAAGIKSLSDVLSSGLPWFKSSWYNDSAPEVSGDTVGAIFNGSQHLPLTALRLNEVCS